MGEHMTGEGMAMPRQLQAHVRIAAKSKRPGLLIEAVVETPNPPSGAAPWRPHMWARQIRLAIAKHNQEARGHLRIPTSASAYSFRHARISELLQIYGVDPLTVAQQTGTSLVMIEKSYLRFIRSSMRKNWMELERNNPRRGAAGFVYVLVPALLVGSDHLAKR